MRFTRYKRVMVRDFPEFGGIFGQHDYIDFDVIQVAIIRDLIKREYCLNFAHYYSSHHPIVGIFVLRTYAIRLLQDHYDMMCFKFLL